MESAGEHPFASSVRDLHIRVAEIGLLDLASLDAEQTRRVLAEIADIREIADLLTMVLE